MQSLFLLRYHALVHRALPTALVTACLSSVALALTAGSAAAAGHPAAYTFVSAPHLHPPRLQVLERRAGLAKGDFLVDGSGPPTNSSGQNGPIILDSHADPIWFHRSNEALVIEQESYHGSPVLVFSAGGALKIVNEHYRALATVKPHAPWTFDGHDAAIMGNDVWVTVIRMVSGQNLTPYGGPSDGTVIDCGLQEYDLGTRHLLRTWDVLNPGGRANVPLSASEVSANSSQSDGGRGTWDAYHLNAVQALPDGNLLVSMRNTWAVYLVDPSSGRILWTLGGRRSSFKVGSGAHFSWQHDARLLNPALVGWGSEPYFSEYSRAGRELLDARWPGGDASYRALFTDSWVGTPLYPPRGAVRGSTVYASWNGATEVSRWKVLAGSSSSRLKAVASHRRTGFETAIAVGKTHAVYEVQALSASGRVLGTSKTFS